MPGLESPAGSNPKWAHGDIINFTLLMVSFDILANIQSPDPDVQNRLRLSV